MTVEQSPADRIREYIANCNGTENYYRHAISRVVYTDGVKVVAEAAGAFWLIDVILSHQNDRRLAKCQGIQVWRLVRDQKGNGVTVTCDDGGIGENKAKVVLSQHIEYTDFPKDVDVVFFLENNVLLLREER